MTSLRIQGEVRKALGTLVMACKAIPGYMTCLEAQCWEDIPIEYRHITVGLRCAADGQRRKVIFTLE